MDFRLPAEDDPRRLAVRHWLKEHPRPQPRDLAEAGYAAPSWPRPWGLGADPEHQLIINDELDRAGVDPHGHNPIGIGWAGPTILHGGTAAQKERFLDPLLRGEEIWCQLFSEPDAGSDLVGLQTRAIRDGDNYIITGQKVWTSMATTSDYGILLARTDPTAPRHQGISYLLCPMRQPGITVRPIREMTGRAHFNEVFFDHAVVPRTNLLGEENAGWSLAKFTLGNERVALSAGGVLWGMGPTTKEVLEALPNRERWRMRATELHIDSEVLRLLGLRILSRADFGPATGTGGSGEETARRPPRSTSDGSPRRRRRCLELAEWRRAHLGISVLRGAHDRRRDFAGVGEHHRRNDPRVASRSIELSIGREKISNGPAHLFDHRSGAWTQRQRIL